MPTNMQLFLFKNQVFFYDYYADLPKLGESDNLYIVRLDDDNNPSIRFYEWKNDDYNLLLVNSNGTQSNVVFVDRYSELNVIGEENTLYIVRLNDADEIEPTFYEWRDGQYQTIVIAGSGGAHRHNIEEVRGLRSELDIMHHKIEILGGASSARLRRYGFRIDRHDPNPATRIEYIYDAVGMEPVRMDYDADTFEYGSWADVFFVKDNYPVMVGYDGVELYKVDPNDYSKKLDGSPSLHTEITTPGNLMSAFPLMYYKQWESDSYQYFVVCQEKYDDTYKAFAFTDASGNIRDKMYLSVYRGYDDGARLRSLSGKKPTTSQTAATETSKAAANGSLWSIRSWAQRDLVSNLVRLLCKSDDAQTALGNGNINGGTTVAHILNSGTLDTKGQFYGKNDNVTQVKVFHIEGWWGDIWERIYGLLNINGQIHVKMTPPYNFVGTNFIATGLRTSGTSGGYISNSRMREYGRVPYVASGTSATYECDGLWYNNNITAVAFVGGGCNNGLHCGASTVYLYYAASYVNWNIGAALSCKSLSAVSG